MRNKAALINLYSLRRRLKLQRIRRNEVLKVCS